MNHFICNECSYIVEAETPPETCPSCKEKCEFADITCYIPECGGPGNIDQRLVIQRMNEAKKK
jgi:rubredoxin